MADRRRRRKPPGERAPEPKEPDVKEWGNATVSVVMYEARGHPDATLVEMSKSITRDGKTWTQRLVLNVHQIRAIASDAQA